MNYSACLRLIQVMSHCVILTCKMLTIRFLRLNQSAITRIRFNSSSSSSSAQNDADTPTFDMPNPFMKERRQCVLCAHDITPDYKNVKLLSQFQSPYTGRIYGRHITGLCTERQQQVEAEIRKAQNAGLMATYLKEAHYLDDPRLFDVEKPLRPHRF